MNEQTVKTKETSIANITQTADTGQEQPPNTNTIMGAVAAADVTAAAGKASDGAPYKPMDEESKKGKFGWFEVEKVILPFILRHTSEKYMSVRMVERRLLNRYLQVLPPEVNSCTCIKSYYITDAETKLFNEINLKHSDCVFGKEAFTSKDLVVTTQDASEFYKFLDLCYKKLVLKKSNASDRCGFFRIGGESVVPYTVKEGVKYVPLFYFEGETDHLNIKSDFVEGWDLAYLKFCCKVQGIRNELFAKESCKVVALDEIKGNFPSQTTFEDYWPAKGSIEPLPTSRHGVSAGNWTQKPSGQPSLQPVQMQTNGLQNLHQLAALNAAYRLPQQLIPGQFPPQGLQASQLGQQFQQLIRAGVAGQQPGAHNKQLPAVDMSNYRDTVAKAFPGKLTQIKLFPVEKSNQPAYKLQKALIDQKIVPCINVRPFVFHDLMMTFPDFVEHFFPDLPLEKSREMLQEILKVVLYKGNTGHQEILRREDKCRLYDPVPLVLVKDIMTYMPQIKYMFASANISTEPPNKRPRVN